MKQAIESADVRALRKVLNEININVTAIRSNAKNFVSNAIVAGELLTKIKADIKYGDWGDFLESIQLSYNTADRYMGLWKQRTAIDLNAVKSLTDAEEMIAQLCLVSKRPLFQGIEKPTTQNQGLTHEKNADSEDKSSSGEQRSIQSIRDGVRATDTQGKKPKARPCSFDPDPIPRDNLGAYVNDLPRARAIESEVQNDEIDPVDKIPRATKEDVALAKEFGGYPKSVTFSFHVTNEDEENQAREIFERTFSKKSDAWSTFLSDPLLTIKSIPPPSTIVSVCIAKICQAYKDVTKKKLTVDGPDKGQISRLIEGQGWGEVDAIADIFRKACLRSEDKSIRTREKFWSNRVHKPQIFAKDYGLIRNEVSADHSPDKNQIRETIHVRSL